MSKLKISQGRYEGWILSIDSTWYESGYGDDGLPTMACCHQIRLESPDGYTYFERDSYDNHEDAEVGLGYALSQAMNNRLDLEGWIRGRPVYGSLAYQREGCEQEQIERERDAE